MLRYLALGDSYTIGEGVADGERWPNQLAARLRAQGIGLTDPRIVAATGWTTDELRAALDAAGPMRAYDLVSVLIGVNDQYRGRDLADYLAGFRVLLQRAIDYAGARAQRVLVLSIPDWGATVFGKQSGRDLTQVTRELDAYNAAAHACCRSHGVTFIDITHIGRRRALDASMSCGDGLHPSAAMYGAWTQAVLPYARKALA